MIKLLIVVSLMAGQDPEWRGVAEALRQKHESEAQVVVECACPTNCLETLRRERPRYAAFVIHPDELNESVASAMRDMMRNVDDDPFDDAIWGVVTGPSAADALRIASSRQPAMLTSMLATTGVDADVVDGPVTVLSDAYPAGEWWHKDAAGDISRHSTTGEMVTAFVEAWNAIDPEILLTSSHATEHNLEMPFSRGMIVSRRDGQGLCFESKQTVAASPRPCDDLSASAILSPAKREKVWLAAGNCLIANHVDDHDMVMTALSFGKVNQFVGYTKPTWFGFIGWNTWRFFKEGYALSESYYAANQWLNFKLALDEAKDEKESKGLKWDQDATLFYGDPMHRVCLPSSCHIPAPSQFPAEDAAHGTPDYRLVIFPSSRATLPKIIPQDGFVAYIADDFALILPEKP